MVVDGVAAGLRHAVGADDRHRTATAARPRCTRRRRRRPTALRHCADCRATASTIVATPIGTNFDDRESAVGDDPAGAAGRHPAAGRHADGGVHVHADAGQLERRRSIFDAVGELRRLGAARAPSARSRATPGPSATARPATGRTVVAHVHASPAAFNVTLTVTNDRGVTASTTQAVTVDAPAGADGGVHVLADGTGGQASTVFFNADGVAARRRATRSSATAGTSATARPATRPASVEHTRSPRPGTYSVVLTVTDEVGQTSTSRHTTVIVGTGNPTAVVHVLAGHAGDADVHFDGSGSTAVGGATIVDLRLDVRRWHRDDDDQRRPRRTRTLRRAPTPCALTVTDSLGRSRHRRSTRSPSCHDDAVVHGRQSADRRPSTPGPEGPGVDRLRPARRRVPPRGQLQEAVDICRAGLAIHPGYLSARVTLGRALLELQQLDDAQQRARARAAERAGEPRRDSRPRRNPPSARRARRSARQYRAALALARNDPDLEQTVNDLACQLEPSDRRRCDRRPVVRAGDAPSSRCTPSSPSASRRAGPRERRRFRVAGVERRPVRGRCATCRARARRRSRAAGSTPSMSHAPSAALSRRHQRVRAALAAQSLDALVVTSLPNILYLTNFTGSSAIVVLTADGCTSSPTSAT